MAWKRQQADRSNRQVKFLGEAKSKCLALLQPQRRQTTTARTLLIFALALRLVRRRIAPSPCPGGGAARASLCRQGTGWLQSWREGVWRARRGTAIAEQAPQQRKTA